MGCGKGHHVNLFNNSGFDDSVIYKSEDLV